MSSVVRPLTAISLIIIFTLSSVSIRAQTQDSTEIKLQHYKEMFIKGLITAQEYETLKHRELGIEDTKTLKEKAPTVHVDSAELSTMKSKALGNIGGGASLLTLGAVILILEADVFLPKGQLSTASIALLSIGGGGSVIAGAVLLPVGIVQMHHYKQKAKGIAYLSIGANGIGLAYNF